MKNSLVCHEEKSKETQKELDVTLEKLEKQREEKEKLLQQQNTVGFYLHLFLDTRLDYNA